MVGRMSTEMGDILIDKDVISKVAGLSAIECYGIVGMAMINVTSGIAKLLKRESLTKGIAVTFEENIINIDLHIIVEYGVNITAVTDNLICTVQYKVEKFSGMKVGKINIYVEGVRVDE
ncbi:MAG: Asp23/Gls24 family envelope stress response protein [Firmicutes bacterium HGW-Firmicutes-7]|nr:MAG: Asp23/Gls24 family envelope stress response protein [Firmicutes bacterium HGW-Firmicutes-7]